MCHRANTISLYSINELQVQSEALYYTHTYIQTKYATCELHKFQDENEQHKQGKHLTSFYGVISYGKTQH